MNLLGLRDWKGFLGIGSGECAVICIPGNEDKNEDRFLSAVFALWLRPLSTTTAEMSVRYGRQSVIETTIRLRLEIYASAKLEFGRLIRCVRVYSRYIFRPTRMTPFLCRSMSIRTGFPNFELPVESKEKALVDTRESNTKPRTRLTSPHPLRPPRTASIRPT